VCVRTSCCHSVQNILLSLCSEYSAVTLFRTFCCHSVQNHSSSPILLFTQLPTSDLNPHYFTHRWLFSVHCSAATVAKLIVQNMKHCKECWRFPHKLCKPYYDGVSLFNWNTSSHRKEYTSNMFHDDSVHYLVYHVGVKLGLSKECRSLSKMCWR
jgi:hypothetical protein